MGFGEKMIEKGERLLKERTQKEFLKEGSTERTEMQQLTMEDPTGKGKMVRDVAVGLFGGKLSPEKIWIHRLEYDGFPHWYIQPFTRTTMLPGEHHALLEGGVPATVGIERAGFFRSPDMLTPAVIPVVAGNRMANRVQ